MTRASAGDAEGVGEGAAGAAPGREAAQSEAEYLRRLGVRVRETRTRRGMTRRILARDSGISERYLAQLEGGQGNISIVLLRQVAHAMGVPLVDLVREEPDRGVEHAMLLHLLDRLSPKELARARRILSEQLRPAASDRRSLVALIGLRGAGKSTLGRLAAERLGVPFVELDREVERETGLSMGEVFQLYGQAGYRRAERRCLEHVAERHDRAVITTGGSIVSEPATFDALLATCFTVWVKASPEEHMARVVAQGDMRPMADNAEAMEDLRRILALREPLYAKADAVVDTTGRSVGESLAELMGVLAG